MYLNCFKALKQDDYLKMIVAVLWLSLPCSVAQADIYYSAKVFGPVVNIHAIDEQGQVKKITNNNRWRDVEHDVASNGLISFASNRISNGANVNLHRQENYQIFLKQTKTDELVQVSLGYEQARKPKFSPGNDKLAFIALEGQQQSLIIYDLATKATKRLQSAKFIYDFSWSPDDQHIAVSSQHEKSAALVIVDSKDLSTKVIVNGSINQSTTLKSIPKNKQSAIETSEQLNHAITKQVEQLFVAPTWSPNGNYIAYISHPLTKQSTRALMVYQLAGQKNTAYFS
jgi:Tol biopolymer transport system component